jgi:3-ketosteroid 9alpha-monooxygenase subunit A
MFHRSRASETSASGSASRELHAHRSRAVDRENRVVNVPFTWQPTGWFMVGWSAEIPVGAVKPLQYFGQHLVAYRSEDGTLHVLDGHCLHLGAHLGHHGTVHGDCVECPYHGWGWGPDGANRYIPYEDRPNLSKQLKVWPTREQHECVFVWHDPSGDPPRWDLPNVFELAPDRPGAASTYYRAFPELSIKYAGEPVHPQIPLENAVDSVHFKYVHRATVDPVLLDWEARDEQFVTRSGWPLSSRKTSDAMALVITSVSCGVGGTMAVFEGGTHYRLVFFVTPVDDQSSDMFYSIWWPKDEAEDTDVPPDLCRQRVAKEFLQTLEDDLEIWRYQVYVSTPALAQQDAKPYGAVRKWARQFYEIAPV